MRSTRPAPHAVPAVFAVLTLAACGILATTSPPHPSAAPPPYGGPGFKEWRAALAADDPRIVVSLRDRVLWLLDSNGDTLLAAPIAIGRDQTFTYRGKTYHFRTPRGRRRVLAKKVDPKWVPPEWHYYEKAARRGLEPVRIEPGKRYLLEDSTIITMRDGQVGRINRFGNFWPFTPGMEIIFDGKIFIPPIGTPQREIPNALGDYALDLGDGYLIHGTHVYNRDSIGRAASHGCIRMRNKDIARLFKLVEVGTPVYIY
ncbi:MAG TPA: L,D-transpeptidase [Longimicrobiales bacterium]